jgi:hypothetical protein
LASLLALCAAFVGSWLVAIGLLVHRPAIIAYSPHALAIALILLHVLTLLLYWRSWPIDRWMEAIVPSNKTLGELSDRSVDHVSSATDLNFGVPFFFSTADKGRLCSTLHGLSCEAASLAPRQSASGPRAGGSAICFVIVVASVQQRQQFGAVGQGN